MLAATNITYRIGSRELLSDVSATFSTGQLHLIVGPNGAGKSTLIKVLARLLRPQSGSVTYEGEDASNMRDLQLAKRRAVLSQAVEAAFPLSVRELVMMGRYPHFSGRPAKTDETAVDEMMEMFEVTEFAMRNYQTLSGGERQRVNFARVLAQLWRSDQDVTASACRYLFLDEPLTFLDIRHQIDFMKKIKTFSEASDTVTVGVVHDLNLAARFADQIVVLDKGQQIASGSPNEVLTASLIRGVFGVEPMIIPVKNSSIHLLFD